jgi:hypothetical protein
VEVPRIRWKYEVPTLSFYVYIYIFREEKVRRPRQQFSTIVERRSPLLWCRRCRVFRDLDSGTKTKKKNEESVDVFTNWVKNEE